MRFALHFAVAALAMAVGIGARNASAIELSARDAVAGREKVREELAAALAKGSLTRMDQYKILLHAKEVLTPDDLHALEQSLDRIAANQAAARAARIASHGDPQDRRLVDDGPTGIVTPSNYQETKPGELPTIDPTPKKVMPVGEGENMEVVPSSIGKPSMHIDADDAEACGCEPDGFFRRDWLAYEFFSSTDAFKGPIDIGDANGNFGEQVGANSAVQIFPRLGIGLQLGTSLVLSDLKGIPYPLPNATIRDQLFVTVGMFQRINREEGSLTWGFAYDWLFDEYYAGFNFGQWRVKAAWEFSPWNEFGLVTSIPEHGSSGALTDIFGGVDLLHFKPIAQGNFYWTHTFCNEASVTAKLGAAEKPGEFVFGTDSRMPLTDSLAVTTDVSYIMPRASGGANGQAQEIWNVSVGLEFVPGAFRRGCWPRFQPFIPVADNGSMAVRELGQ
jgi:hypothetical protein